METTGQKPTDEGFSDWYWDFYHEDPVGVETLWGERWSWDNFWDKFISDTA